MPKITVLNEQKKEIEVPEGTNLRQALRAEGVQVYSGVFKYLNCRGLGVCGTCAVLVKDGVSSLSGMLMTSGVRSLQIRESAGSHSVPSASAMAMPKFSQSLGSTKRSAEPKSSFFCCPYTPPVKSVASAAPLWRSACLT